MRQVTDEEVIAAHHGTKLSVEEVGYLGRTLNMFQFVDIFAIPEVTLLRDVTQVLINRKQLIKIQSITYSSISLTIIFLLHLNMCIMMSR